MRTAFIGMGGNMPSWAGTPENTLAAAVVRLESLGQVVCRSSLYSTAPVGFTEQSRFVNAVVELRTELEPQALLNGLLSIEQEFGRDRSAGFLNGPRTLDLDLLLFEDLRISEPGLELPHPRLAKRRFVLVPLCEIAPRRVDAESQQTMKQLLQSLNENTESETDAVLPIQSDSWCAGAGGSGINPGRN